MRRDEDEEEDALATDEDATEPESRAQRAARMKGLASLSLTLVGFKPVDLAHVPLPPELAKAVLACQGFTKNARARQLRHIAGLLRTTDVEPIEAAVREVQTGRGERSRWEKEYERWRTRLLEDGPSAVTAFVAEHPGVDIQALRQRIRTAQGDPASARSKGAARELIRMIRAASEEKRSVPPSESFED